MQTAAAYYWYNNLPYHIVNNPIRSPSTLMTQNGALLDDGSSHIRPSNNDNNLSNSLRYLPNRNNRKQSSHSSQ
jgi:hypothetical protein